MKYHHIAVPAFQALALSGCSEDPLEEARGEFLSGCTRNAPLELCECAFGKLSQIYTPEELLGFEEGKGDLQAFYQHTVKVGLECR